MQSPHDEIADRADFFAEHLRKNRIRSITKIILYDLDFYINCEGFDFLLLMIPKACGKPLPINLQELYCDVARECPGYSEKTISGGIEDSIKKAWSHRRGGRWAMYFPDYVIQRKKAPTNKEFVKSIVFFIDMWQESYEKEAVENEPI